MTRRLLRALSALVLCCSAIAAARSASAAAEGDALKPGARVWLHAHNCYPEKGQWPDRIDRALAVRTNTIAIEQDVAWFVDPRSGVGRSVVSHDAKPVVPACLKA